MVEHKRILFDTKFDISGVKGREIKKKKKLKLIKQAIG